MKGCTREAGFTLLELLLAAVLTLALAGVALAVTLSVLNLWRRSQDAFVADAQAKLVLDFVERDVQAALFRDDGAAWFAVDAIDDASALANHGWLSSPRMKPANATTIVSLGEARFGRSGAWLRFVTTNVESGGARPVVVSYQLARRPVAGEVTTTNPASVRYSLFRSAVSPEATFSTGYDVRIGYSHGSAMPPAQRTSGTVTNPSTADALATHVVEFGVWLYRRNASGELLRIFPATAGDASHAVTRREDFPDVVEVMIRILTEEGARQIETLERGDGAIVRPAEFTSDADWWWSVAERHSRVYVRRIAPRSEFAR